MPLLPHRRAARPLDDPVPVPPALRPPRAAAWWIVLAVLLVGAAAGGTLWWLLADLAHQSAGQPVPGAGSARGEILRTALAAGAGVGAAITLALAFRRQNHQELHSFITARHAERVATATEHDAAERRVTDLYTKAAEQLGHDRAAVRLAGLYALERLAQDNPLHRQTIVNVICAYLRMPYAAPESASARESERKAALLAARRRYRAARLGALAVPDHAPRQETDREGELQVRLTAQRVLAEHLRDDRPLSTWDESPPSPRYWEGMRLDLTGATLIDFELTRARFTGSFDGVTFSGRAGFDFVTFSGDAGFDRVTFTGDADFARAIFSGEARFGGAAFSGEARFGGVTFSRAARFDGVTFSGEARFGGVMFSRAARFDGAVFSGDASFSEDTWFDSAVFSEDAKFDGAVFSGAANFGGVAFSRGAAADDQTFFTTWQSGEAFSEATFTGARATPTRDHVWPDGWHLEVGLDGTGFLVADSAAGEPSGNT
ncbi:pentapeptide repeat-containing protein [Microbispora triticiradicis]|uniref:pentapeptide repeat-containing protein n=1 Tax=Microbispora triticiradicis TaxID=2200763 RepID=UPI001058AFC1|nr:pentapeptide repeat-containing protein [Microbispora triticiradicis]